MRLAPLLVLLALVALVSANGCGGHKSCMTDSDCSSGDNCAYPTGAGCGAQGTCETWSNQCDDPPAPSCGCDGKTVFIGCGYPGTPVPVKAAGYCAAVTGNACASGTDCDPRAVCAYPIANGCNAVGTCVAIDNSCMTPTVLACGCDGMTIGIGCAFGEGNAVAPVASMGACDGGALFDGSFAGDSGSD